VNIPRAALDHPPETDHDVWRFVLRRLVFAIVLFAVWVAVYHLLIR
jgi:hypothetical protein